MEMPILRCEKCGHGTAHQVGIQFCSACGVPVGRTCRACAKRGLTEDRFCAFCGVPSDASPTRHERSANDRDLADLVAQARQRAGERRVVAFPESKAHLEQSDLDSLFADRLDSQGERPCV